MGEGKFQNELRILEIWVRGRKVYSGCDSPHPAFNLSQATAQVVSRPLPQGARLKGLPNLYFSYFNLFGTVVPLWARDTRGLRFNSIGA